MHVVAQLLSPKISKGTNISLKHQIQPLIFQKIELEMKGIAERCYTMESDQFGNKCKFMLTSNQQTIKPPRNLSSLLLLELLAIIVIF